MLKSQLVWERRGCHPLTRQPIGQPERVRPNTGEPATDITPSWEQLGQLLRATPGHASSSEGSAPPALPAWSATPTEEDLRAQLAAVHSLSWQSPEEPDQDLTEMAEFFGVENPGGLD